MLIRLKRIIHFPSTFPARRVGQLEVLHRVSERLKFRCQGQELNIYVNLMRTHGAIEMKHTSKYAREAEVGLVFKKKSVEVCGHFTTDMKRD